MIGLSKRASSLDYLKKMIFSLWDVNAGPFENILGLSSYIIPFVPGGGWMWFAVEKIMSSFGMGADDLGREIDNALGLSSGSNIKSYHEGKLEDFFNEKIKSASRNNGLEKNAGILSSLFMMTRFAPKIAKLLMGAVKVVLLALGVEKISEVYKAVEQDGLAGAMKEVKDTVKMFE